MSASILDGTMCTYCGCQSLPAIRILTDEHDQVIELIGVGRAAYRRGETEALPALCRQISAILGPHTRVEEKGLFPPVAVEFPDQIAVLRAEHRQIESVLAEAADGTAHTDQTWPERVMDMLDLLRRHIMKEQDGVFPAALSILSTDQWDHLGELRVRVSNPRGEFGAVAGEAEAVL